MSPEAGVITILMAIELLILAGLAVRATYRRQWVLLTVLGIGTGLSFLLARGPY